MRQVNLKIVKASELLNETKGSLYCEIIFKDMKFKTKPVKDKLIWDNIFELGDYRGNDTIIIRLVSRRSATLFGGCSIPLKEYKKCGIFEKEMSIFEGLDENMEASSFNKKNTIGVLFVEVIIFSPISLNRTQSEKRMNLNIFSRFRNNKDKLDILPPPTSEKKRVSKNGTKSAISLNKINSNEEDSKNGIQESQSAITFGEIEAEKPERERKRKRRKKKSEEDTPIIESTSPREKKKERRTKSEKRDKEDDEVAEVVVVEREKRIKRKNSKVLRRSVSLAHNEKSYSKSEPAIRRRSSRKNKEISRENSENNNDNIENNNNNSNNGNINDNIISIVENNNNNDVDVTVVKITPLASSDSNLNKLFGVSLEEVIKRQKPVHPDLDVPHFFVVAAKIIRENHTNGGNLKGIFRIRGKLTEVKELRKKIDNGDDFTEDPSNNVHSLSTLMKAFLRELPIPLLTFENYDKYIKCADLTEESQQILLLKDIVDSIPFLNYTLLKFVMQLMHELSLFPEETQMTAENLAKIISPNLIWKEVVSIDDMSQVDDALKGVQLANIMIVHYQKIFTK